MNSLATHQNVCCDCCSVVRAKSVFGQGPASPQLQKEYCPAVKPGFPFRILQIAIILIITILSANGGGLAFTPFARGVVKIVKVDNLGTVVAIGQHKRNLLPWQTGLRIQFFGRRRCSLCIKEYLPCYPSRCS
ncbi:hypothetical protein [Novipirellula aureliae]|nr:hypothetical protein [Novipirellula aureliae]